MPHVLKLVILQLRVQNLGPRVLFHMLLHYNYSREGAAKANTHKVQATYVTEAGGRKNGGNDNGWQEMEEKAQPQGKCIPFV